MKKTITRTFLATLALLFSFSFSSDAQTTYHDLYLCDNATASLVPSQTLSNGDKVHWFRIIPGQTARETVGSPITYSGAGSANLTLPTDLTTGLYQYFSAIESAAGCLGPDSDPFNVYKLPTKTLALTATNAAYCAESSGTQMPRIDGSVITATTTPTEALPDGIGYAYDWTVTFNGATPTVAPGSAANGNGATNNYTMTTTTAGTYVFDAKVKYVALTGNTGVFKSPNDGGCQVNATANQQVLVTPKPTKPTITIAP